MAEFLLMVPEDLKDPGDLLTEALVAVFSEDSTNEERELRIDHFNDQIGKIVEALRAMGGKTAKVTVTEYREGT